jgi:NAD(P)-dependent dehydrogenase (short-subunit alcohol dehydrogenase family)
LLGFATTVDDVIAGADLAGKTAVVTGASSGLGLQTVAALASAGADVVAAVRDPEKFRAGTDWVELGELTPRIRLVPLDLARLASVRAAAQTIAAQYPQIDILINNAGVMFTPHETTADGFELQFGIDHLGHFQLTTLLLPQLHAAAVASGDARVVTVTSEAHRNWGIDLDDINFDRRGYDTFLAYGQAKSANILMTVELHRRWGTNGVDGAGITALAVHPGTCATNLARYMDRATVKKLFAMGGDTFAPENMKSVAQAAATTVWAATEPSLAGRGGAYLADCQISEAAPAATDSATAQRLWLLSQQWVQA